MATQHRRDTQRHRHRIRKYGMSNEVFEEMVAAQGGRCLVCSRKQRLEVDHDHDSGVVRGLLCHRCNLGLGQFEDNPILLKKAIRYLMKGTD